MGRKKKPKEQSVRTGERGEKQSRITLPAFGLAEDILDTAGPAAASGSAKAEREQGALPAFGLAEDLLGAAAPARPAETPEAVGAVPRPEAASGGADRQVMPGENGEELHLVTFRIDQEEYAVEIGRVQEIIRVGTITTVPNSQVFIQGVINLRGRVIPVLNLRKRLHLPDSPLTKHSRIMIVETGAKVLGMLVDGVSQVMRIPSTVIDAPPGDGDQKTNFVSGIGRVDSRLILLMNLERVLARDAHKGAPV